MFTRRTIRTIRIIVLSYDIIVRYYRTILSYDIIGSIKTRGSKCGERRLYLFLFPPSAGRHLPHKKKKKKKTINKNVLAVLGVGSHISLVAGLV